MDCVTDFQEMPEEMLKILKDLVHIETDAEVEERIVKFIMKSNNIGEEEFIGFPDAFKQYMLKANQDKFNVLLTNSTLHDDVEIWG